MWVDGIKKLFVQLYIIVEHIIQIIMDAQMSTTVRSFFFLLLNLVLKINKCNFI